VWLYWNVSSWQLPCCQSLKSSQDAQYRKMHRTPFKMNNTTVYLCMNTLILAFISIAYSLLQYTPVLTVIQTHFLQVTRTYHDWWTAHSSYCLLHAQTQNSPSYRMSGSHTFPFCVKIWYPLFGSPIFYTKCMCVIMCPIIIISSSSSIKATSTSCTNALVTSNSALPISKHISVPVAQWCWWMTASAISSKLSFTSWPRRRLVVVMVEDGISTCTWMGQYMEIWSACTMTCFHPSKTHSWVCCTNECLDWSNCTTQTRVHNMPPRRVGQSVASRVGRVPVSFWQSTIIKPLWWWWYWHTKLSRTIAWQFGVRCC